MSVKILVKYKMPKDKNWHDPKLVNLSRLPTIGEYIAVGNIEGRGCLVKVIIHTPGKNYDAEIYGDYADLDEVIENSVEWDMSQ